MRTALARRIHTEHEPFAVMVPEGLDEKRRGMLAFPKPVPLLLEDVAQVTMERTPWPLELYGIRRRPDLGPTIWTVEEYIPGMPWSTPPFNARNGITFGAAVDSVLELPPGMVLPVGTALEIV